MAISRREKGLNQVMKDANKLQSYKYYLLAKLAAALYPNPIKRNRKM